MQLPCPQCGEPRADITVDMSNGSDFLCLECENSFTRADIESLFARWQRAFQWLDAMPTQTDIDEAAAEATA